jgi:hypothetical protein
VETERAGVPPTADPASRESSLISEADIALYLENLPSWGEHQGKQVDLNEKPRPLVGVILR